MTLGECFDHLFPVRAAFFFADRGELCHLAVGDWRVFTERANAFVELIYRRPLLRLLLHDWKVQQLEMRAFDIPVIAMGLQVKRVSIRFFILLDPPTFDARAIVTSPPVARNILTKKSAGSDKFQQHLLSMITISVRHFCRR
ncbi:MAG: hypothetical protein AAFR51_09795 [Pseudomonadota bacterium]